MIDGSATFPAAIIDDKTPYPGLGMKDADHHRRNEDRGVQPERAEPLLGAKAVAEAILIMFFWWARRSWEINPYSPLRTRQL
jgi:hypothetical protein